MNDHSNPLYGLVENVRSLWNVGSIFRTSDAVALRKLYLCGYTGKPPRPEISKTALGSEETVPWEHVTDPLKAILMLRELGVSVVALERTGDSVGFGGYEFRFPVCLVVGNEVEGVSRRVLSAVDATVEIPMHGSKTSLNVAVAYGVGMYECVRRL